MWECLAVSTGLGLGKLVLEQVLKLSKPALESYVQDFFNVTQATAPKISVQPLDFVLPWAPVGGKVQ